MYAQSKRNIASGHEYNAYFPPANQATELVKQNGDLGDTTRLMQEVIAISVPQTAQIAPQLKGRNLRETCQNIFDFVYKHINYRRDDKGKEQVRSAARTWHDRHRGVDCDCYSVFISSILINLGIAHAFRIAKYDRAKGFQHVYIVVPEPQNPKRYYTIDPVLDDFDKEHQPLIEYRDYPIAPEKYESFKGLGEPITAAIGIITGGISLVKTISGLFGDKRPKTLPPEQIAQVAAMAALDNHFPATGEFAIRYTNSELYRAIQVIFEEIAKEGGQIDPTWVGAVYWMLGQDEAKGGKQTFINYQSTEWPLMIYPFFQAGRVFTPQNLRNLYQLRGRFGVVFRTEQNKQWVNKAATNIKESWELYKKVATQYRDWQAAQAKNAAQGNLGWLKACGQYEHYDMFYPGNCRPFTEAEIQQAKAQEEAAKKAGEAYFASLSEEQKKEIEALKDVDFSDIYGCKSNPTESNPNFKLCDLENIAKVNPDGTVTVDIGVDLRKEIENWFANGGLQIENEPFDYIPDVATPEASTYEVIAAMQNTMLAAAARSAATKSSVPETQNAKDNSKALLWIGLGTAGLLLIGATAYYVTNKNKNT